MSVNLLDLAKSYLSDGVVSKVSTMLGENEENTQKAFDGALPAILGGLIQKSAEPGGNGAIMDMIGQVTTPDRTAGDVIEPIGGLAGNLGSMLTDNLQSGSMLSAGAGMIQNLFGNGTNAITDALASYSGIKSTSATSLMGIAGSVLLSVLGKKMADDETGVSGLSGLLTSQQSTLQSAVPSSMGALLGVIPGLNFLSGMGSSAASMPATPADPFTTSVPPIASVPIPSTPVTTSAPPIAPVPVPSTPVERIEPVTPAVASLPQTDRVVPVAPVPQAAQVTPPVYSTPDETASATGKGWLPWLLLALGALGLFFFLRSCRNGETTETKAAADSVSTTMDNATNGMGKAMDSAGTSAGAAMDSVGSSAGAAMDSAGSAVSDAASKLGAFFKRKLPSGLELNIPEKGIENNLVTFIEDKNRPVDKTTWFNFDRLLFDTGKATLRPESKEQLDNTAAILKEFPNVSIKLGGYTDNTGSAAMNKKLSQDRANTVMNSLVELGIDKSRLEAEGYGPEHPVASNDTPAGRAENRRIAVRVTKK